MPSRSPAPSFHHVATEKGELLALLVKHWPEQKRNKLKALLKHGAVFLNGKSLTQFNAPVSKGDKITVRWTRNTSPEGKLVHSGIRIIFEDEHLLVADKPEGLLSISTEAATTETLYYQLNAYLKNRTPPERVFVVHRLDRDTSGLLLLAKSHLVKTTLQKQWVDVEKTYLAIVEGVPEEPSKRIESFLRESKTLKMHSVSDENWGKQAITSYELVGSRKDFSLLKVGLETGRKNQIRVHLADLGHPIAGDKKYGATTDPARRLALHAYQLKLRHPVTRKTFTFTSEFPATLAKIIPYHSPKPPISDKKVYSKERKKYLHESKKAR